MTHELPNPLERAKRSAANTRALNPEVRRIAGMFDVPPHLIMPMGEINADASAAVAAFASAFPRNDVAIALAQWHIGLISPNEVRRIAGMFDVPPHLIMPMAAQRRKLRRAGAPKSRSYRTWRGD